MVFFYNEGMIRFYLLRHGQTQFNLQEIVQGHNDSPLTELGIYQARCAGYGARNILFNEAYCGLVQRQYDTAVSFLSDNLHPCAIEEDYHFNEMGYGRYEGRSYYEMLNPLYEDLKEPYNSYDGLYKFYDDMTIAAHLEDKDESGSFEGSEHTYLRFREGLDLLGREKKGNILISTSSFGICTLISHLFPDFEKGRLVENASLTVLKYEEDIYTLEDYNDISFRHIGEEHYRNL